ncbi:MAG: hypothetical protein HY814_11570 [Candidatus Riflebacteria bacterium]|nr:hypothetical protein [Candidatus Riflebacteria bacterium]
MDERRAHGRVWLMTLWIVALVLALPTCGCGSKQAGSSSSRPNGSAVQTARVNGSQPQRPPASPTVVKPTSVAPENATPTTPTQTQSPQGTKPQTGGQNLTQHDTSSTDDEDEDEDEGGDEADLAPSDPAVQNHADPGDGQYQLGLGNPYFNGTADTPRADLSDPDAGAAPEPSGSDSSSRPGDSELQDPFVASFAPSVSHGFGSVPSLGGGSPSPSSVADGVALDNPDAGPTFDGGSGGSW